MDFPEKMIDDLYQINFADLMKSNIFQQNKKWSFRIWIKKQKNNSPHLDKAI